MFDQIETKYSPENDWEGNALWDIVKEFELSENDVSMIN